ncbi:MAG TPA: hypothetical protein V6C86_13640 [Oculatellaceae cyanobacterium]
MSAIVLGPRGIVEAIADCTAVGAATLDMVPELPKEFVASFVVVVVIVVVVVEPLGLAGLPAALMEFVEEAAEVPEVRGTASAFGACVTPLSEAKAELTIRVDADNIVAIAIALEAVP